MKKFILTILVILGIIILAPLMLLLYVPILALADEEELRENGFFLSARERNERYNQD